ncbi:hypothetical protein N7474_010896 [Penicillium riverlandense]|uniref:uncharacterized protein n=1 Tax=Penicillium riverlandense TaxID=1903569 RepID=UPI0025478672|nr:uncharacterized protein N7474_010896 [Penicillium riverlandense]KAJ5805009.1 hypothetical protein N7474_010896 [Penicillium riverlandense]
MPLYENIYNSGQNTQSRTATSPPPNYRDGILEPALASEAGKKGNFRKYATCYWAQHYARVDQEVSESQIEEMMATFITEDQGICFAQWLEDVNELVESRNLEQTVWTKLNSCRSAAGSPIFVACVYGILGIMRLDKDSSSKEDDHDVNQKNFDGATPIYLAARYGHSTLVQFIIEQGAILDVTGGHFGNPLQVAAFQGFEAVAHILLEKGASPCAPGKFTTAIDAALAGGHEAVILLLLGYEQVVQSCEINKILEKAAHGGHFAVVCDLQERLKIGTLDKVPANRGLVIEEHHNALQMALFRGRARIAKAMLKRIPDINESGGPFGNAIQAAAYGGHVAMIELILCHGGTVHLEGRYGTPLRAAALGGHDHAVQLLIDRGAVMADDSGDALEAAAFNGRLSTVKTLFDSGLCDRQKYTFTVSPAVRAACFRGHLQVATYLLTLFGSDAAHHALEAAMDGAQGDIVQLALAHHPQQTDAKSFRRPKGGICIAVPGSARQILPLEASLERAKDKKEQYQQLTCKKKSTSRPHSQIHSTGNQEQQTPKRMRKVLGSNIDRGQNRKDLLLIAVQMGFLEVVGELLDQGFNINSRGQTHPNEPPQLTPIEEAVILDRVPIIELLLNRGAYAKRALKYAVVHQNERVIRLFLQKRPKIEVEVSLSGKIADADPQLEPTALSLAVEKNYPQIVRILMDHVREFYDFKIGSALATAVRIGSIPMIEILLGDIELRDLPDDSFHSDEYFAFYRIMEEAAQTRNIPALKVLLKHVDNRAMYNQMVHDYIKHSISEANWYGVVHCLYLEIEGLIWSTLLETAFLSSAEKLCDPWDTHVRCPYSLQAQAFDMERDKQAKGRLLNAISCGARESDRLLSSYLVAFKIAADSRNTTMMNFILTDSTSGLGASGERFLGVTNLLKPAALYYACQNGDWELFNGLIKGGADPFAKAVFPGQRQSMAPASVLPEPMDPKDIDFFQVSLGAFFQAKDYESPLKWLPILTWFLDSGIEVNTEEPGLVKSLHLACGWGFLEYVEKLVEKGVSVSALDQTRPPWNMVGPPSTLQHGDGKSKTQTAIQYALEYVGDWEDGRAILETCEYLVEVGAGDADCKILLHAAAKAGNLNFAKRLLLRGICPDRFPTHSRLEMMQLFEEFGFDLISTHDDAPEQQGEALQHGRFPLFEYLVSRQGLQVSFSDWSVMERISHWTNHDKLQYVIRRWNFDLNTIFECESEDLPDRKTKKCQFNLLQKACYILDGTEQAGMLLKAGASIDCPGLSNTALEVAVKKMRTTVSGHDISLVELLLEHGANVHGLKTGDEPTKNEGPRNLHAPPLLLVLLCDCGDILKMVELLVKHGADVNAGVIPPLRVASQKDHHEVVKFLVQHGAVDNGNHLSFSIDDLMNERRTIAGIPLW